MVTLTDWVCRFNYLSDPRGLGVLKEVGSLQVIPLRQACPSCKLIVTGIGLLDELKQQKGLSS